MGSSINSKMVAIGKTYPSTCLLIRLFIGTCIQWRQAGVVEQLMSVLHAQVRQQAKKKLSGLG